MKHAKITRRGLLRATAATAGGLALGGVASAAARMLRPPNILLICIDALRADRLGCAGYPRSLTPFIDSLAARGVTFTDCVSSSSWTKTAVATMLTGLHPFVHSVMNPESALPPKAPALQSVLRRAGYTAFCFHTNPWVGEANCGFQRGFELFRFFSHSSSNGNRVHMDAVGAKPYIDGAQVAARIERMPALLARLDRPFFGYVHLMDVHGPYLPLPPYNALFSQPDSCDMDDETLALGLADFPKDDPALGPGRRARVIDLYDGGVRAADEYVRRIVESFADAGLLERTAVVVLSDHGEELWEHGWTGHAKTLYEEVLRFPMVMAGAGLPQGAVVSERVRQVDLAPTILDLAGARAPRALDGTSVLPLVGGASRAPESAVSLSFLGTVSNMPARAITMLAPNVKYIETRRGGSDVREVYNLFSDPGEQANLAGDEGLTASLEARFDSMVNSAADRAVEGVRAEMSDEMRAQLRSLGYLH